MKFGLTENVIHKIQQQLYLHNEIENVIIYGSRAKGNYKTNSDIDLTIKGNVNLTILNTLENELDDLLLPYKIDISIYNQISNIDLVNHIDRVGQLFYSK